MKFITKKGKSLGIGLAMVGSLLVSSLQAGPVYLHSGESIVSWKLKPEAEVGGGSRNECSGSAERRL